MSNELSTQLKYKNIKTLKKRRKQIAITQPTHRALNLLMNFAVYVACFLTFFMTRLLSLNVMYCRIVLPLTLLPFPTPHITVQNFLYTTHHGFSC